MNVPDNWIKWSNEFITHYLLVDIPGETVYFKNDFTEWFSGYYCHAREHLIVKEHQTLADVSKDEIKQFYYMLSKKHEQLALF